MVQNALSEFLGTYPWTKAENAASKRSLCLTAETRLFSECGKILLTLGGLLNNKLASKKGAMGVGQNTVVALTPAELSEAAFYGNFNIEQELHKVEKNYRKRLLEAGIFDEENRPLPKNFVFSDQEPDKDKKGKGV